MPFSSRTLILDVTGFANFRLSDRFSCLASSLAAHVGANPAAFTITATYLLGGKPSNVAFPPCRSHRGLIARSKFHPTITLTPEHPEWLCRPCPSHSVQSSSVRSNSICGLLTQRDSLENVRKPMTNGSKSFVAICIVPNLQEFPNFATGTAQAAITQSNQSRGTIPQCVDADQVAFCLTILPQNQNLFHC